MSMYTSFTIKNKTGNLVTKLKAIGALKPTDKENLFKLDQSVLNKQEWENYAEKIKERGRLWYSHEKPTGKYALSAFGEEIKWTQITEGEYKGYWTADYTEKELANFALVPVRVNGEEIKYCHNYAGGDSYDIFYYISDALKDDIIIADVFTETPANVSEHYELKNGQVCKSTSKELDYAVIL